MANPTGPAPVPAAPPAPVPSPTEVDAAFRSGAYACFLIAFIPALIGVLLLTLLPGELTLGAKVGPFAWTAVLVALGAGLLRKSIVAVWAALIVAVGAGLALLGFAIAKEKFGKPAMFLPLLLLAVAVPKLWKLRAMWIADRARRAQ